MTQPPTPAVQKEPEHYVTSRADGYGYRDCSCGGRWKDGEETCSSLESVHQPLTDERMGELREAVEELEIMFRQLETIHDNTGYVDNSDFVGIDANLDNVHASIKRIKKALRERGVV